MSKEYILGYCISIKILWCMHRHFVNLLHGPDNHVIERQSTRQVTKSHLIFQIVTPSNSHSVSYSGLFSYIQNKSRHMNIFYYKISEYSICTHKIILPPSYFEALQKCNFSFYSLMKKNYFQKQSEWQSMKFF